MDRSSISRSSLRRASTFISENRAMPTKRCQWEATPKIACQGGPLEAVLRKSLIDVAPAQMKLKISVAPIAECHIGTRRVQRGALRQPAACSPRDASELAHGERRASIP